jgi:hypothetical protein
MLKSLAEVLVEWIVCNISMLVNYLLISKWKESFYSGQILNPSLKLDGLDREAHFIDMLRVCYPEKVLSG